uniref:Coiled-coil domain containing 157 n=1 Tax=Zonotrichia albicollis TaxID=44394 RepID=A0A8D2QF37_ZONAL|nr:coiled-coil domain-containing protein 157 [Zonotrichia albicollis]
MGHFLFDPGSGFVLCSLPQEKGCRWEIPTQQSTPPSALQVGKCQQEHLKSILPEVLESGTASEDAQPSSVCPDPSAQPRAGTSPALSTRSVPTQTPGSPLGSCDSCSSAQASLHEVGRAITSICQSQNIPSALSKFQEVLEDSTGRRNLSAADMSYWASEQSKDLSRINKHLQGLLQQLNPVRAELEKMGKQKDKLQKQVEDFSRKLQAEKSIQAEQQKAAEQSLKAKEKEHSKAVARLEEEKDELRREATLLEEQLSALKEELAAKEVAVQELEFSKTALLEEVSTTMVARSQVLELEEKVQVLTGQRDSLEQELGASRVQLEQELSASRVQLEKEKVHVESLLRHEEVRPAPEPGRAVGVLPTREGPSRLCHQPGLRRARFLLPPFPWDRKTSCPHRRDCRPGDTQGR